MAPLHVNLTHPDPEIDLTRWLLQTHHTGIPRTVEHNSVLAVSFSLPMSMSLLFLL